MARLWTPIIGIIRHLFHLLSIKKRRNNHGLPMVVITSAVPEYTQEGSSSICIVDSANNSTFRLTDRCDSKGISIKIVPDEPMQFPADEYVIHLKPSNG